MLARVWVFPEKALALGERGDPEVNAVVLRQVSETNMMIDTRTEILAAEHVYSSRQYDPDYADLLPLFVEELPSLRTTLLEFAKVCDFENVKREAHKLRGSAGGYGYSKLSELAGQLEDTCKSAARDSNAILQDLDQLIGYIERVRA